MLRGEIDAAAAGGPDELLEHYGRVLAETVETVGQDTVESSTDCSAAAVERAAAGDVGDLSLETAASILATDPDRPDAETLAADARDILLLGMTTAVLDVESLASELNGDLDAKELQQKIEGRFPITLAEYAAVHYHLREHVA
jgi:voltage-gated potassium channel Kch